MPSAPSSSRVTSNFSCDIVFGEGRKEKGEKRAEFFFRFRVIFQPEVSKKQKSLPPYLEGHHDLDGVERVSAEVDELGVGGDLKKTDFKEGEEEK